MRIKKFAIGTKRKEEKYKLTEYIEEKSHVHLFLKLTLKFFPECATLPDWMKSSFSDKTTRIIGGQVAPSPIPWQAHLYVDNISRCAAVIIDEETVLTAALAIMENPKSTPPVLFDIASLKIEVGVLKGVFAPLEQMLYLPQ